MRDIDLANYMRPHARSKYVSDPTYLDYPETSEELGVYYLEGEPPMPEEIQDFQTMQACDWPNLFALPFCFRHQIFWVVFYRTKRTSKGPGEGQACFFYLSEDLRSELEATCLFEQLQSA